MNKKLLTTLGCSGSVALALIAAEDVSAKEFVFKAPEIAPEIAEIPASEVDYPLLECSCSEYDAETAAEIDRLGDQAIDLYGCDCAGCRNLARNIAEEPSS